MLASSRRRPGRRLYWRKLRSALPPSTRSRHQPVAAVVRIKLAATLAPDRGATGGGCGVLRDGEGAAQAVGAGTGLARGERGTGGADADHDQGGGGDFDQQSHSSAS